jgi:hypothetical protein
VASPRDARDPELIEQLVDQGGGHRSIIAGGADTAGPVTFSYRPTMITPLGVVTP